MRCGSRQQLRKAALLAGALAWALTAVAPCCEIDVRVVRNLVVGEASLGREKTATDLDQRIQRRVRLTCIKVTLRSSTDTSRAYAAEPDMENVSHDPTRVAARAGNLGRQA